MDMDDEIIKITDNDVKTFLDVDEKLAEFFGTDVSAYHDDGTKWAVRGDRLFSCDEKGEVIEEVITFPKAVRLRNYFICQTGGFYMNFLLMKNETTVEKLTRGSRARFIGENVIDLGLIRNDHMPDSDG